MTSGGLIGRLHRTGMRSRFMLTFGSVVLSLMVVVVVFASQRQSRSATQQIEMRGQAIAQSLATGATRALLTYDHSSLQRLAEDIRAQTGAVYVIIHDKENTVAGAAGSPKLPWDHLDGTIATWALALEQAAVLEHGIDADDHGAFLEVATPVRIGDEPTRWGTVRVGLSLDRLREEVRATIRDLSLVGFLAVIVVMLSAHFFTNRIIVPLREFAAAASRVAAGQLDQSLDENLSGEIGEAARSFNTMTRDLRRSRDAIRYQQQHLENTVQERTAALRQKARELEKANAELKEVDRLKSDFLSNVSHELRTPLTSIRSFTEILADGTMVDEDERKEFLGIISSQTDRLTRLIGDLLDLSKIEAGEFYCNVDALPLPAMVLSPSLETVRRRAEDARIEFDIQIDEDLPEVLGDSDRLSQVAMNLLDNALKFTDSGGHVTVRAYRSDVRVPDDTHGGSFRGVESDTPEVGSYVVVSISDSGCGIAVEDQRRVFEKFGQVGNVLTSKPQGTGLGLAISASIMVQHGGALWLQSRPGEGSTFTFSVPVSDAAPEDRRSDSGPRRRLLRGGRELEDVVIDALVAADAGSRVLLVDDDVAWIRHMTLLLEPLGFRAMGCEGSPQAAERARELTPDAIVLDSGLGDANAWEILRRLRQSPKTEDTVVLVIGPAEEAQKAYDLGATVHVARNEARETILETR